MHPASSHADNSASYQNYPNNPPSEQPNNPFKAELTAAQAAYLTRLLPTFYSFQLDARSARRLPSSSKQVHEVKPPAEPKRKSTKVLDSSFRMRLSPSYDLRASQFQDEPTNVAIINLRGSIRIRFTKSIVFRKKWPAGIAIKD